MTNKSPIYLQVYNQFYDNKSLEIRSREVNNRLVLEEPCASTGECRE